MWSGGIMAFFIYGALIRAVVRIRMCMCGITIVAAVVWGFCWKHDKWRSGYIVCMCTCLGGGRKRRVAKKLSHSKCPRDYTETYHNQIINQICIFYTVPPKSKTRRSLY